MSRQAFVKIAAAEVGVKEITSNRSPRILQYRDATSLGRNGTSDAGWAWCSAFVCFCVASYIKDNEAFIAPFRSARANDWELWKAPGVKQLDPKTNLAKAGDIVTFEFDKDPTAEHVGIVEFDQIALADPIKTIEGNTSANSSQRDGAPGEGVFRRVRKVSVCRRYVRWL